MRKRAVGIPVLACILSILSVSVAQATLFEPEFELVKITGTCTVKRPGAEKFEDAIEKQKYPYGTIIKTGRNSAAIVRFSQYNGCRVFARSTVAINENMRDKKVKVLNLLDEGKIQVKLESEFRKHNELTVETPSAVCGAIGCNFAVAYQVIGELRTTSIFCHEGELAVFGYGEAHAHFSLAGVGPDRRVSVAMSPDGKFTRIKIVRGDVRCTIRDSDGAPKQILLKTDDEVQILTQRSEEENMLVVIYRIKYADPAKPTDVIQCHVALSAPPVFLGSPSWPNITVTMPTPGQPSPTPVGKRD